MDFWPKDDRTTASRQRTAKSGNRDYPYLEPGMIGAATLLNTSTETLEWNFLAGGSTLDSQQKRLKVGRSIQLFPPTKPKPPTSSYYNVRQRAEQGANFLRTYLPDVDITAELIREHLTEEANLEKRLEQFDPFLGTVLNVLPTGFPEEVLVLFPTGELSRDLNISTMQSKSESELMFIRWSSPAFSYSTPIRQIASNICSGNGIVAVRSFGDTCLSRVHNPTNEEEPFSLIPIGNLRAFEPWNKHPFDVHLSSNGVATTVNQHGFVAQYDINLTKTMNIEAYQHITPPENDDSDFWQLIPSRANDGPFVMSHNRLSQVDTRTKSTLPIFSLPASRHLFTSAEMQDPCCISVSSTKEIIWLDTRFPDRPLLTLAHGRQYDRTLRLMNVTLPNDRHLCVLHSRFNSMISVYDTTKSENQPLLMNDAPHFLPFETLYDKSISKAIVTHSYGQELLCLGEDGQLTQHALRLPPQDVAGVDVKSSGNTITMEFNADKINQLSQRVYCEVDVSGTSVLSAVRQAPLEDPEAICHASDEFPRYLQTKELPTEYMLTLYDIAFRSGSEPEQFSRSDFLASSTIKSDEGFQALLSGKFSPSLIKAPFKASISETLSKLGTPHTNDPSELYEDMMRTYLAGDDIPKHLRTQQNEACRQLAFDLALSSTVLHENGVSIAVGDDRALETMAGALSIGDEPRPYTFGYLKPLEGFSKASYDEERRPLEPPELPSGVRLLMKTWDNSNPFDYEYHDAYTGNAPPPLPKKASKTPDRPTLNVEHTQPRPPVVSLAIPPALVIERSQKPKSPRQQSQEAYVTRFRAETGSQPLGFSSNLDMSQTPVANTQVVSGPYGGRPQLKKKPVKKRIGGF
ncbi:hypothetical protein CVT24_007261 [Panaeolus cyanescens]|uniref:RNA polymerase I-specific transcription initiation factor RRN6-like protein n=1 Tax=Panaeolus cyanescens TaxID=181874 RepID=A0A409WZ38_9AGAR|nr:hypothetical protein CVT24_007261 [Panaeolus cyanescens]